MIPFTEALSPAGLPSITLTVSTSVVAAATANILPIPTSPFVLVEIQVAGVSVRYDGADPTASVGHQYASGTREVWTAVRWNAARFIRSGAADATVFATPLRW